MKNLYVSIMLLFVVFLPGLSVAATGNAAALDVVKPQKVRAWHFVLRSVPLDRARWMVDRARDAGFNSVVVVVTDGVKLDHAPWKPLPDAWSKDDFSAWVGYARSKGMDVIPEIKLLTHQEKFMQRNYPDLMFNTVTYDPSKEQVYERVFSLLDEIILLIHPRAIHIGHDEVAGHSDKSEEKWLREGEKILSADLFYKDVKRVLDYLKGRGIETWMWGDMLISPDEFPGMKPNSLHGTMPGYGKPLRDKLPRDIVICDWHYYDKQAVLPSLAAFKAEGFRVLGSTWKNNKTTRNFSRYATAHGADGMIATTWFHVQRKEWDVVERIIRESGEAFRKDFPDAK